jgi:hypothetical protein
MKFPKIFLISLFSFFLFFVNTNLINADEITSSVTATVISTCNTVPVGYTKCADENGICDIPGPAKVAFGCENAQPDPDYTYKDFSIDTPCTLAAFNNIDEAPGVVKACSYKPNYPLTVNKTDPSNSAIVTSTPAGGISCGADCSELYLSGSKVSVNASAVAGYSASISGGCNAVGAVGAAASCEVTMDAAKTVSVIYSQYVLTVTNNLGSIPAATVTSAPAGISCGTGVTNCTKNYAFNTPVTINAPGVTGYSVAISGSCSDSDTTGNSASCQVIMNAAKSVAVEYKPLLTVTNNMASTKIVTSSLGGISCGTTDCIQNYALGSTLQINAPSLAG